MAVIELIDCDTAYCVACSDDSKLEIIASNIHDVNKNIHVHACMHAYVSGSSKIQTLSHDSSSIEIEVYNNGKTHRLLKLLFFVYKCTGILLTSIYITQRVLATPTLNGT